MSGYQTTYRAPDCPGCGNPACLGKSVWGHDILCCSDKCGEAVRDALAEVRRDDRYKFFARMLEHAEAEMTNVRLTYLEMLRHPAEELIAQTDAALGLCPQETK